MIDTEINFTLNSTSFLLFLPLIIFQSLVAFGLNDELNTMKHRFMTDQFTDGMSKASSVQDEEAS